MTAAASGSLILEEVEGRHGWDSSPTVRSFSDSQQLQRLVSGKLTEEAFGRMASTKLATWMRQILRSFSNSQQLQHLVADLKCRVDASPRIKSVPHFRSSMGTAKRHKTAHSSGGVKATGKDMWITHKLHDHRRVKAKNNHWVEEIQAEWEGGAITWERRKSIEAGDAAEDVRTVVEWASQGRTTSLAEYRRKHYGKLKYTAGESRSCGFVAFKIAFDLIGMPWVTDPAVAAYIASGNALQRDYAAGCTWEQLLGFVGTHGHAKLVSKNLRHKNEEKLEGLGLLTNVPGVYVAGFARAHVGHLVVVHTTSTSATVIDESGSFPLTQNKWMDGSPMVRVHRIGLGCQQ